ncbi:hypothetical protein [Actinomycetospora termitidis]|uniref:Uncharacterized protein n=1 Tax=Actinomycetospora termitidis TaxID=3053470 RepID=A0ABT7M1D9_9PSEU|nr:hypothetical protein [Actinomycetospora sp. Odt1-22]MDL5154475.1 hypothetical protein [Actinomycetospora sp. Odt1-22]
MAGSTSSPSAWLVTASPVTSRATGRPFTSTSAAQIAAGTDSGADEVTDPPSS